MTEEHTISSASTEYRRKIWYLPPVGGAPTKIALFLDGEYYVNRMDAPAVVRDLETRGAIPSMVCVFVSHVDGAARHIDLTCNPRYTQFLVGDVLGWIRDRYPALPSGGHLVGGTSLSGLAAAFVTLNHPEVFSQCVAHSGSFWWSREWLRSHLAKARPSKSKFWLSVGSKEIQTGVSHSPSGLLQEIAQVPACERFGRSLRESGHDVHYRVYEGGHEIEPWKAELPDALRWLLSQEPEPNQSLQPTAPLGRG